jgi:lipoprotein-releasing system permease protein
MNSLSLRIAWKYIRGSSYEKNISRMVIVSFASVFVGSFALALVASIMRGFEYATHEKIQSIHAPLTIRSFDDSALDYDAIASVISSEFPEIRAFGPASMRQAIIQATGSDDITHVVALKGVEPEKESEITAIDKKILTTINGTRTINAATKNNGILIGNKLAASLNLIVGDEVTILFTRDEQSRSRKITLGSINATIGGILSTGIEEFDSGAAFCSQQFFETVFPDVGITTISLVLQPHADEQATITKLKDRFELDVYSWTDLYPALVAALKLEKIVMLIIVSLIVLVATMNIISLLFMQIHQKRSDIAILQSMGMTKKYITQIFMWMGLGISFCACVTGLLFATIASYILEKYPLITLPDVYYVTHVPARMEYSILLLVFTIIMVIAYVITRLAAYTAHKITISNILRFEA